MKPMPPSRPPAESPLVLDDQGQPRSRLYGDVYFSTLDGLAESRAVFLQGCGLPEAWAGRRRFTVGELGFGTGLNILALLGLWRRTAPAGAWLDILSIEAHPLAAEEAAAVLAAWPEVADLAELLVRRWPGRARGFHRLDLPEVRATLDLAVMEAGEALAGWTGAADAWFLDGFAPSANPQMWRQEVLDLVAARSAAGARAATFTVAGDVRRALQAAGFEVAKRPGFGRKRERLEARRPGEPVSRPAPSRVAVIGAGVAGASVRRALGLQGVEAVVFDARGRGSGGSGNPAALVTPRLDAGLGPVAALFAQALARARRLYQETPEAVIAEGVLQLARSERDAGRFARIAASDLFEPGEMLALDADAAAERAREPVGPGLWQGGALVVRPQTVLAAWLPEVTAAEVAEVRHDGASWRLAAPSGEVLGRFDAVAVCAGPGASALVEAIPLQPVRGQIGIARGAEAPAAAWGGYAAPADGGIVFGATHDRDEASEEVRPADHRRNLDLLAGGLPRLARGISPDEVLGRASVRAVTPDRLPAAGRVPGAPDGLHILGGLGSRGFCLAPLLAEHLVAQMLGAPSPLPAAPAEAVAPDRFLRRAARRSGGGFTPD